MKQGRFSNEQIVRILREIAWAGIFPVDGAILMVDRAALSGPRGSRRRPQATFIDPPGDGVYNVDTFKENIYGSRHP
jgi:hypothetical protein